MDSSRLKRIPVFADLDDDALNHIAALAAEVSVPEGSDPKAEKRMLLKSTPAVVDHLRNVVEQRKEHA